MAGRGSGNPWVGKTGRAVREAAAIRNYRCEECGHSDSHVELKPTLELVDGTIVETPHPDYEPLVFRCEHDGCDCTIDRRPTATKETR